jgi:hypothetical protein
MVGFYRIWIPDFGLIAKPLYEAKQRPGVSWEATRKLLKLKDLLLSALDSEIPDLNRQSVALDI